MAEQKVIKAPPDPREPYRRQLVELIMGTGLTQTELASRVSLSDTYVCLLCNYKRYPSLYALITLLKECGHELQITKSEPTAPTEESSHGPL